jgi:putative spermidine/putrescine transport system permease protein
MLQRLYGREQETGRARYILLTTFVVAAVVYIVAPTLIVVISSFNSKAYNPFPPLGLSWRWYQSVNAHEEFKSAAILSIALAVSSSAIAVVVGAMAAYSLVRRRPPGHGLFNALLLSPIVMPRIVLGVGLFALFATINIYGTFWSIMLAHALMSLPFTFALIAAALVGLDPSLEEAAQDLGARRLRAFFRVVLPQIRVPVVIGALIAFIGSLDQLESTIFLTRPGGNTLPVEMYDYTLQWQDPTTAALSTFILAFSLLLVVAIALLLRRGNMVGILGGAATRLETAVEETQP